ncbi:MAG: hypothetical protein ACYSUQ_11815 [Planctomycetota bacterium]|jgi:hypothetical protein
MRALLLSTIVLVVFPVAGLYAQPALTEPPEFPSGIPGPSATHSGEGCFHLAAGAIVPGDVDWVQIAIPVASTQTIVDVDFPDGEGSSALLASIVGGSTAFNIDDGNSAIDDVCGLGSSSDPLGSPQDSVVNLGATALGDVINIGVTGAEDTGFNGQHNRNFSYDVWVYIVPAPCTSDPECDDGLFCNGAETCVAGDCEDGVDPCPGQECDEDNDECVPDVVVARVDIKPGACPNQLNRRGRSLLSVALVGTGDFDATMIDVSSVRLSRVDVVGGSVAPHEGPPGPHSVFEDVATPFVGETCECDALEGDGIIDLSMHFRTDEVVESLELNDLPAGATLELVVTGTLLDGTLFEASDCITLVPGGSPMAITTEASTPLGTASPEETAPNSRTVADPAPGPSPR